MHLNSETFIFHSIGYWKIVTNSQTITSDAFTSSRVFVLAGPREKFTENEFDHLKRYLETGGSLLVLLGEGTSINFSCTDFVYFTPSTKLILEKS